MTKIVQLGIWVAIGTTSALLAPITAAMSQERGQGAKAKATMSTPTPQMRTYVSGQGNDSNRCMVDSPCRTFQAALALTIAGGEIFVLDSAGYGTLTINKAVTITSEGAVGGVLATSGTGITISAGASDVIHLRGLDLDGGNTGSYGILFSSGRALTIQKSAIRGFVNSGISFAPNAASALFVSDTTLTNNRGSGILVTSSGSGAVNGAFNRITASGNGVGILANGANVNVTLTDTLASNNTYGIGASAAAVMVRNSTASNNSVGIAADQGAIIRVGQSTVTANATGWQATNGAQTQSYGNNNASGNTSDGTVSTTTALQ